MDSSTENPIPDPRMRRKLWRIPDWRDPRKRELERIERDPYASFKTEELMLRDYLSADRTTLANESTLLAYVRTALAFVGGGVGLLHLFETPAVQFVGWVFIPAGAVILGIGGWRYMRLKARIDRIALKRRDLNRQLQSDIEQAR